ncbi:hypothetical protein FNH47_09720 [Salmonella enterica subsp. houtenae]|uniref:Uncharacterized protein n=1 Tax=Salmonella houtenae TaxID=59205 RepID=A0A5Y2SCQ7_SALHO|nr:hypothetical protein [Salmonella enterica subsp. houtenae]QKT20122.1 hypothetical protein HPG84_21520 [Salmonella enterica]HAU3220748.1 hypothetical protein [Salmonella enterica subsp. houtenae]HCL4436192.1 hypothetical protein [Salmonella enterica]HCL5083809.1 hypothetical protein [Salmonella enterica]
MSFEAISMTENQPTPGAAPGETVIVPFTFDNNGEADEAGAKIHAEAPEHCTIVTMSCAGGAHYYPAADNRSGDVITGLGALGVTGPSSWTVDRTITLQIDADAPIGVQLGGGVLKYVSAEGVDGPQCELVINSNTDAKPIDVTGALYGNPYADWQTGNMVYPYRISLQATDAAITNWRVFFDQLPAGSSVYDNGSVPWYSVLMDGAEGSVEIANPDTQHRIEKDTVLNIDISMLLPITTHDTKYDQLYDLVAYDLD